MAFEDILSGIPPNLEQGGQSMPQPPMPSPSFPSGAPGGAVPAPDDPGASGMEQFTRILRVALPALAAVYGARRGGAGAFAQSYGAGEQQRADNLDRIAQRRQAIEDRKTREADKLYQRSREARMDYENTERIRRQLEEDARRRQEAEDNRIRSVVQGAVDKAAANPAFIEKINTGGADSFSINVPGVGPMNMKEAFDRLGVVADQEGQYHYGKPEDDPFVTYREAGAGGTVTEEMIPRSERVKRGRVVVSRPAPKEPKEPKSDFEVVTETGEDGLDRKYRVYMKPDGTVDRRVQISGPPETGPDTGSRKTIGRFTIVEEP